MSHVPSSGAISTIRPHPVHDTLMLDSGVACIPNSLMPGICTLVPQVGQ